MGDMRSVVTAVGSASVAIADRTGYGAAAAEPRSPAVSGSLKILHMFRAPLGGLFRHVVDLAGAQADRGHRVGLIFDSTTGGSHAEAALADLAPRLALGFARVPIRRPIALHDLAPLRFVSQRIKDLAPDVLHGHGAKGGALARLVPGARDAIRVYTPHGGSLIYCPGTLSGKFYRSLERILNWRTDLFLFESGYSADIYRDEVDGPRGIVRVVPNGVSTAEFAPVEPAADATDIICVGELRPVKALDVIIAAIATLARSGRRITVTIAGAGPEDQNLKTQAQSLGVAEQIRFIGHCPARRAFAMGKIFVIPSRAESLPYVALEAAAAGMPIIATAVGDIPGIFGPDAGRLIPADNVSALVRAIELTLDDPAATHRSAAAVTARVRERYSLDQMVEGALASYREALAARRVTQTA